MKKETMRRILYGAGIVMLDLVLIAAFYFCYIMLWLIAGATG